ncbi:MAG: glycosyltransferase family 2 protein [Marivita sp.]|uniref:glycosyltransferase family 2 protein n=1 Tax=Marivita sp. TaxID=2003365 RepID=UPI003EF1621E
MVPLSISVVVVSHNRPIWLKRCLRAIGQLDYPRFEITVVACPDGAGVARNMAVNQIIPFDTANISAARNIGVADASGDVVAFIDDDAVPEPTWLWHLAHGFEDPLVAQAGGTTLGRNGITVQHGAARVGSSGQSAPVAHTGHEPVEITPEQGLYPRLHGTNMAIRRATILEHGGFDERYAFYLDETDLSFRIAQQAGKTLFVPKAVVHHASGPSQYRDDARTPRSVFEIAASAAVFHKTHCADADTMRAAFLTERRNWILRHMVRGTLPPDRANELIKELAKGYAAGLQRPPQTHRHLVTHDQREVSDRPTHTNDVWLVVGPSNRPDILAKARDLVQDGHRVTVFDYDRSARFHRVAYTDAGYWHHTGGIFGREVRTEPLFQKSTQSERIHKTLVRLDGIRAKNCPLTRL